MSALPTPLTTVERVLVVEDDPTVAEVVSRYLEREGYAVETIGDGRVALARALEDLPALVVLDLMLPGLDGLEVCRRLRDVAPIPVIMLTARGDEEDRVVGLELGADDYLAKPFSPRELTARVKAVLRRAARALPPHSQPPRGSSSASSTSTSHRAKSAFDGLLAPLTAREFDLLAYLAQAPRRAFRREEILEQVWGFTYGDTATVTVHIRRLREKIESDPSSPRHLVTVWGVGYRFEP